jgi:arylsulfatase
VNQAAPARTNVLLICVDHWPGALLGCAGHPIIQTPTLDMLAASGVRFANAYSATPTCVPARRALMTGTTAKTHGDRTFREREPMPAHLTTLPAAFGAAGYQCYAVGKMHVFPQRARFGFDEIILAEEGRHHLTPGFRDDYERFLADEGHPGEELTHGMGNNLYTVRPWHLPEACHNTHWTTREMCRTIQRRDPTRPAFWYCSYQAPHPPITPPRDYLEMYRHLGVDKPYIGEWAKDFDRLPYALKLRCGTFFHANEAKHLQMAREGFYAQCTYIDHQLRLLVGTLREEGLLEDTVIAFISDHGDMLGNHQLWCKPPMFEWSAQIPMIISPPERLRGRLGSAAVDSRLTELRDIMPTLLDLCEVPVPATVEGLSLAGAARRDHVYCEHWENDNAMRMVRDERYKLIWYPVGNRFQLFDLRQDPKELRDLADEPRLAAVRQRLAATLRGNLWGTDERWVQGEALVGEPDKPWHGPGPNRNLSGQRGWR